MTIMARRFTFLCLFMGIFAVGLTMVVEHGARGSQIGITGLSAPCPQPAGIVCRTIR